MLALNAGSSSVKCALFTHDAAPRLIARETLEGAGSSTLPRLLAWIDEHSTRERIVAVGHRVVHGGPSYRDPQRLTPHVLDALRDLIPFAPNHLPDELSLIDAVARRPPLLYRWARQAVEAVETMNAAKTMLLKTLTLGQ